MKKVKTALKYIAVTLLILVVAQAAKQIGRAAAQPVDNPPQHVQEERTIKQARVDVYHHEAVNGWQPCVNGEDEFGECK
jgi:hypothetical protein|nr:MAG TPA: hypothetical protein [Caudoviricetes sp.]